MSERWHTSREIRWRADFEPRPDFQRAARTIQFTTLEGAPLFSVTTAEGVPSDGILTLIRDAPRLRDELTGR